MNPFDKQEIEVTTKRKETTQEQLTRVFTGIEAIDVGELVVTYCTKFSYCTKCPLYAESGYKERHCLAHIIHRASGDLVRALKEMK